MELTNDVTKKQSYAQADPKKNKSGNGSFEAELVQGQYNPFASSTSRVDKSIFEDNDISLIAGVRDFLDSPKESPQKAQEPPMRSPEPQKMTKAQEIAAKKAAQKQNRPSAVSDILKEASLIKDQWKETLGNQGVTIQEKVEPKLEEKIETPIQEKPVFAQEQHARVEDKADGKDHSMTETKDSEFIDQSSYEQGASIKQQPEPQVVTAPLDFGKKPKLENESQQQAKTKPFTPSEEEIQPQQEEAGLTDQSPEQAELNRESDNIPNQVEDSQPQRDASYEDEQQAEANPGQSDDQAAQLQVSEDQETETSH